MIEVLVTLLLISVGVLGMVALQTRTIQYTQDSAQRNVAIMLANDLVEMMRAMPGSSDFYKDAVKDFPDKPDTCTPLPSNASGQLGCWADKVAKTLPVGALSEEGESLLESDFHICRTSVAGTCDNSGSTVEIQIAWHAKSGECINADGTSSAVCYYRLRTQI
ncbi:type IV pilus modification protein PilV [Pseudomonas sp. GOM7]|uniref:type IV pilus modification protein PilV n=1 Tax=Pseudomonas sp. GOM7 TaxID=2998079 RepID=UPI002E806DCD|nr:type IV pilus modification protein PilV [Pseudomonas sp. GOM7]